MSIAFFVSLAFSRLFEMPALGMGIFCGYPIVMLIYLNFFKKDE